MRRPRHGMIRILRKIKEAEVYTGQRDLVPVGTPYSIKALLYCIENGIVPQVPLKLNEEDEIVIDREKGTKNELVDLLHESTNSTIILSIKPYKIEDDKHALFVRRLDDLLRFYIGEYLVIVDTQELDSELENMLDSLGYMNVTSKNVKDLKRIELPNVNKLK